jgi:effector-binding domain-containing protein
MMSEPSLQQRGAQPYAAIRIRIPQSQISSACPPLLGEVFAWLAVQGLAPAGPPFFRYARMEPDAETIDVGVPLARKVAVADDRVRTGLLPAGRYAVLTYTGPYTGVPQAAQRLMSWGSEQGLKWATSTEDQEMLYIESYVTDPMREPDPQKWITELMNLVQD